MFIRSFTLSCTDGVCGPEQLPSCEDEFVWSSTDTQYHNCGVRIINDREYMCGGTKEVIKTRNVGQGVLKEIESTSPCSVCDFTWTPWRACMDENGSYNYKPHKLCRKYGNNQTVVKEEEKNVSVPG